MLQNNCDKKRKGEPDCKCSRSGSLKKIVTKEEREIKKNEGGDLTSLLLKRFVN
jgi:hypothetical protein